DPLDVYRPDRDSADVGVAGDVVHVVGRVGANEQRPQNLQPGRGCESWEGLGRDQEGNPAWVDGLAGSEIRLRRSTQLCYQRGQLAEDEMAADHLVVDAPADEVVLVEEVAKGAVPDVVKKARQTKRLGHQRLGRHFGELLAQGGI